MIERMGHVGDGDCNACACGVLPEADRRNPAGADCGIERADQITAPEGTRDTERHDKPAAVSGVSGARSNSGDAFAGNGHRDVDIIIDAIARRRSRYGVTYGRIGNRLGVASHTVYSWLNKNTTIPAWALFDLTRMFEIPFSNHR